jgi:transcription elongation factor GreB
VVVDGGAGRDVLWTDAGVMADEAKNYITPGGYRRLQDELARLWKVERPTLVTTVAWAAGNGDRSENGDYIYGKRRLREIDRRIRYLSKSLDRAVVVDNSGRTHQQVHFGATVTVLYETGDEREVTIVGVDELDSGDRCVSWRSPLARASKSSQCATTTSASAPPPGGVRPRRRRGTRDSPRGR